MMVASLRKILGWAVGAVGQFLLLGLFQLYNLGTKDLSIAPTSINDALKPFLTSVANVWIGG